MIAAIVGDFEGTERVGVLQVEAEFHVKRG